MCYTCDEGAEPSHTCYDYNVSLASTYRSCKAKKSGACTVSETLIHFHDVEPV